MRITGIIWLEDIVEKLDRKHSIKPDEVIEVLNGGPWFRFVEKGHRVEENVYAALGQSASGRFLIVYFVNKTDGRAVIISAREMTPAERRMYERK